MTLHDVHGYRLILYRAHRVGHASAHLDRFTVISAAAAHALWFRATNIHSRIYTHTLSCASAVPGTAYKILTF